MTRHVRSICLGLTIGCFALSGCGEAQPEAPAQSEAPKPAAPEPTVKQKGKGKKEVNPTADMGHRELREYRRQQKEAGKTP